MQIERTVHSWRSNGKSSTLDKFLHMCAPSRCLLAPLAPAPARRMLLLLLLLGAAERPARRQRATLPPLH